MSPDEVFRFVNVRPVQQAPAEREKRRFTSYDGDNGRSPLHQEIAALPPEGAREAAVALAETRLAGADDPQSPRKLLATVEEACRAKTAEEAGDIVEKRLGESAKDYLATDSTRELTDALWDRLYAHTLSPQTRPDDREDTLGALRALHFLRYLDGQADDAAPLSGAELSDVRPTIPPGVVPRITPREPEGLDEFITGARAQLREVHANVMAIQAALADLSNTDRAHREELARMVIDASGPTPPSPRAMLLAGPATVTGQPFEERSNVGERSDTTQEQRAVVVPKRAPWVFDDFGERNLSERTKETLQSRKESLEGLEFAQITASLEADRHALVVDFVRDLPREALQKMRAEPELIELMRLVPLPGSDIQMLDPHIPEPPSAAGRGIKPLGVGDLLIVRQEVTGYEPGELAHVENVMASENKTRNTSRLKETEETLVTETERTEESEKDLQTTERFELQKESQKTIEMQMSLDAGLGVSASYGPVSITAHADFSLSQSSSESNRSASTYAKQVTEQSVARIKERTRTEQTRRTLERFEELNAHGFDNTGEGAEHIIGVFRWIDKHYRARLINYGRRMMFEFIVPEPAAFYRAVQDTMPLPGLVLSKPGAPSVWGKPLEPTDLTKYNYTHWVAQYNVQGAEAYPDEVVSVGAAFAETPTAGSTGDDSSAEANKNTPVAKSSEKLVVPPDYESESVYGWFSAMGATGYFAECYLGGQLFGNIDFGFPWHSPAVTGVQGIIPISVKGSMTGFHVNVVAVCRIKPEAIAKWQVKTYEAIMNAYQNLLDDYNEQVAAARIQAGVNIEGRNPDINRRIEKDELRKGVLRLLTDDFAATRVGGAWRFREHFDAMQQNGPYGYPDFDTSEASVEGAMIQFFEQAFEWTNMTYRFYPYFWGRREHWQDTFPLSDPDPLFVDFLRAGSARVIVPVQPSYDDAVLHYLATDEIWNGGTPPTLDDPLFRSIVDELKSDAGIELDDVAACDPKGGTYPCLVDEWNIKLPTELVYLQKGAELPGHA